MAADESYRPKTYRRAGGDEHVVASGGQVIVESGGIIAIETGGDITANGVSLIDEIAALSGLDSGELGVLNAVTAGTVTASKAVVVDANKDIGDFRNLDVVNLDAGVSGTAGSVDIFPATAAKGKLVITKANNTNDDATTLTVDAHGQATTVHVPDGGAAASYIVQSTAALTLAEADVLDAVVAGTASASKAVILDASKDHSGISNLTLGTIGVAGVVGKVILSDGANPGYKATVQTDGQSADLAVHVPDPGAMVDAYIALSTAALTAAEVDVLDAVAAGVASASKAAVLGASKNLDILGLPVGGLKIGAAGAEVAVTATAANLNSVPTSTATGAEIDQAALPAAMATEGLGRIGVARFDFNMAIVGDRTVAAHGTGVTLPINAVVIGGFFEVNTLFTSENANNGTIAIMVQGANDVQTATAVSGAPYSSIGLKAIVPKSNTPESTGIKCTAAREITCTVGTSAMLTGKLTGFLHYVVSATSA